MLSKPIRWDSRLVLAKYLENSGICTKIQEKIRMADAVNGLTLLCLTANIFFYNNDPSPVRIAFGWRSKTPVA
ncbi:MULTISPECIES: hypothetical protein [Photorhabdus]|uniref:Uncharacterized protein n=1 Tax=Photorhabdus khanii subsp. guanajuatensis TaxID=2100166 RepID=A0A4R4K6G0_9GAMM|nr:hypothetical protein [Photorhabdus khanii]TDB62252.1 hypothetical protein C5467_03640 [Photorhabdus khanii subsp. guanajuatensis]